MCLAVPGKILSTSGEDFARMARVSFGGIIKEISLAYVPEAQEGSYVLVHVGFAISVMDEDEAMRPSTSCKRWASWKNSSHRAGEA